MATIKDDQAKSCQQRVIYFMDCRQLFCILAKKLCVCKIDGKRLHRLIFHLIHLIYFSTSLNYTVSYKSGYMTDIEKIKDVKFKIFNIRTLLNIYLDFILIKWCLAIDLYCRQYYQLYFTASIPILKLASHAESNSHNLNVKCWVPKFSQHSR